MEFDKVLDERNICVLPFNLRHLIHIPSVRIVNLLCSGGHFSNTTFIDAKTKFRSAYLLDVSQPYLQNHITSSLGRPQDVSEGRPQGVGRTHPLELNIRLYWKILITSVQGMSSRRRQGTFLVVTQRTIWGRPQDVFWGGPQDVLGTRFCLNSNKPIKVVQFQKNS